MKNFIFLQFKKFPFNSLFFKNPKFLKGFTFIEAIVAIAIFVIATEALFTAILMLYRTHGYTWEESQAIEEARRGVETMVREIRNARNGEDGSYPIFLANDKEFIFFSDIDNDGKTERVRYFLGNLISGSQTEECETSITGGSCSVTFSNFFQGNLISAQVKISVEGDLGANNEYVEIFVDSQKLGELCKTGCSDCPGTWQGTTVFDISSFANDNLVSFLADATSKVDSQCPHSMKAKFEFSYIAEVSGAEHELRKGIIEPSGNPVKYPLNEEKISIISSYIRNAPPIFEYYDKNGNKIDLLPARLVDTKLMKIFLVVNINPNKPPQDFQLQSFVQLRNLKEE